MYACRVLSVGVADDLDASLPLSALAAARLWKR